MNTLAWAILCHDSADRVTDLFRQVYRPADLYVLHADRKAPAALHERLAALARAYPNVRVLPSRYCSWGGWSLVGVTIDAIGAALRAGDFSHFLLLSEHHVPVRPVGEVADALLPGESWMEAHPFTGLYREAQADVAHRFAFRHRELPGVGMFPCAKANLPAQFAARLHHGSQWVVLARDVCERLEASRGDPFWQPFQESLLADETALQTVMYGTRLGAGLKVRPRNATFIAWPHLSGTADLTFTEANWHQARDEGYLFIRKRPASLPPRIAEDLAAMATLPPFEAASATPVPSPGREPRPGPAALLAQRFPDMQVGLLDPRVIPAIPACCIQIRHPERMKGMYVGVMSEDMLNWKVSLVWSRENDAELAALALGTTWAVPTKVRVHDLFSRREVITGDFAHGFRLVRAPDDFAAVIHLVGDTIRFGTGIAGALC